MAQKEQKRTVFRRIGGRIVPITVGTAGLGVAAKAANTTTIYRRGNISIDKKKVDFAPVMSKFGTGYRMKVDGKQVATATTYFDKGTGELNFAWIGVDKKFQGKGYSKILSKESVRDNVRRGAKFQFSQVIHKNSAGTNFDGKRDKLLYMFRDTAKKQSFRPISVKKAQEHIARAERTHGQILKEYEIDAKKATKQVRRFDPSKPLSIPNKIRKFVQNTYEFQSAKLSKANSRVFRRTSFKGMKKTTRYAREFRPVKNKITLGIGLIAAAWGLNKGLRDGK